ncbi:MAG: TetR/AcrR family transcriptional regulator [Geminicoccaceae bacterium]
MKRAEKRKYIINKSTELFNKYGFHATSIDVIVAETGIAKTTLYRHFKTKEDLIVSVLQKVDDTFRADIRAYVEAVSAKPEERLLVTFDFLELWFRNHSFYGCPFISAASEYAAHKDLIFQEARIHKTRMLMFFEELARLASLEHPDSVAKSINLLHEGAVAAAQISGDPSEAKLAKQIAADLLSDWPLSK